MSEFLAFEPPSDDDVQKALEVAREQGWYSDEDGFVWDRADERRWTIRPHPQSWPSWNLADGPRPEGPVVVVPVAEVERLREALDKIVHELGVPGPGYPAPVANAAEIAREALGDA